MRLRAQPIHLAGVPGQTAPWIVPGVAAEIRQISSVSRNVAKEPAHKASHTSSDIDEDAEPKSHPILPDVAETRV